MNLTKIGLFILMAFAPLLSVSQSDSTKYPMVIIYEGDTVLVFSMEQGIELGKKNEGLKQCLAEYDIQTQQVSELINQVETLEQKADVLQRIDSNNIVIIQEKDDLLGICEDEKEILNSEIKKQRRSKIAYLISGITGTVFMGYLWVKK
jgi:hypothetical protein